MQGSVLSGDNRARTCDLLHVKQTLSQLSYVSTTKNSITESRGKCKPQFTDFLNTCIGICGAVGRDLHLFSSIFIILLSILHSPCFLERFLTLWFRSYYNVLKTCGYNHGNEVFILSFISRTALFQRCSEEDIRTMSEHLDFRTDSYRKGIVISGTRSALSKELGKMRKDGLIEYNKNIFVIKTHIA